ncbi:MAG: hypothetical protein ACREKL_06440, partial [Chthoniobacterales bacterium]
PERLGHEVPAVRTEVALCIGSGVEFRHASRWPFATAFASAREARRPNETMESMEERRSHPTRLFFFMNPMSFTVFQPHFTMKSGRDFFSMLSRSSMVDHRPFKSA